MLLGNHSRPRAGQRLLVGLLLVAVLLPLVPLLIWSIAGQWRYPALLPQQLSLRGLELLLDPRSDILQGLATSAGIAAAVAVLACLIGFPAGRAIGLYRFRDGRAVQFLLLAPGGFSSEPVPETKLGSPRRWW